MKKNLLFLLPLLLVTFFFTSCLKDRKPENALLVVHLTDAPADYEAVNIDLKKVEYNTGEDSEKGWTTLPTVAGVIDLLKLTGGNPPRIAQGYVIDGVNQIKQLRLVLGENNTIKVKGKEYKLETPSAQQSGLKLKLNESVQPNYVYKFLIDFDAAKSIEATKDSTKYILKPVLKIINPTTSGNVKGEIYPFNIKWLVQVYNAKDSLSASTYTVNQGAYVLWGLPEGTYKLKITPPSNSGYKPLEYDKAITVTKRKLTEVERIEMKK